MFWFLEERELFLECVSTFPLTGTLLAFLPGVEPKPPDLLIDEFKVFCMLFP